LTKALAAPKGQSVRIEGLKLPPQGVRAAISIVAPQGGQPSWVTVVQESDGQVVGGNTYVFVPEKKS